MTTIDIQNYSSEGGKVYVFRSWQYIRSTVILYVYLTTMLTCVIYTFRRASSLRLRARLFTKAFPECIHEYTDVSTDKYRAYSFNVQVVKWLSKNGAFYIIAVLLPWE